MNSIRPMLSCLAAGVFALQTVGAGEPDLDLVKRWLTRQAEVEAVQADFKQERRLRALKRPIETPGKLWFKAPGAFRWELGVPARTIALQRPEGDMIVLQPAEKRAFRFTQEQLNEAGSARGIGFLSAGFPRSFEGFSEQFTVTDVIREGDEYHIEARLNDAKSALVLRKVVFYIAAETLQSRGFYLRFRDSSSITTRFENIDEDASLEASVFEEDLGGYEVEESK